MSLPINEQIDELVIATIYYRYSSTLQRVTLFHLYIYLNDNLFLLVPPLTLDCSMLIGPSNRTDALKPPGATASLGKVHYISIKTSIHCKMDCYVPVSSGLHPLLEVKLHFLDSNVNSRCL